MHLTSIDTHDNLNVPEKEWLALKNDNHLRRPGDEVKSFA